MEASLDYQPSRYYQPSSYYQQYRYYKQRYKTLQKQYQAKGGANSDEQITTYTKHLAIPMISHQGILLKNSFTVELINQAWNCYGNKEEIINKTYHLEFKDPTVKDGKTSLSILDLLDENARKVYQSADQPKSDLYPKLQVIRHILYENFRQYGKTRQKRQTRQKRKKRQTSQKSQTGGAYDILPVVVAPVVVAPVVILIASYMLFPPQEQTNQYNVISMEYHRAIFMILIPDTEYRYVIKITCHKTFQLDYKHEQKIYHYFKDEKGQQDGSRCVLRYHSEIEKKINQNRNSVTLSLVLEDSIEVQDITLNLKNHIQQISETELYKKKSDIWCYGFVTDYLGPVESNDGFKSLKDVVKSNLRNMKLIKQRFSETIKISRHLWDNHRLFHGDLHTENVLCSINDGIHRINGQNYHSIVFFDFDFSSLVGCENNGFYIPKNWFNYPFSRENEAKLVNMATGQFDGVGSIEENRYTTSPGVESFCISFDFIRIFLGIVSKLLESNTSVNYFVKNLHLLLDKSIVGRRNYREYLHILQNWVMYCFKHIDGNCPPPLREPLQADDSINTLIRKVSKPNPEALTDEDIRQLKGFIYSETDNKLTPKPYIKRHISYSTILLFMGSQYHHRPLIKPTQKDYEVFYGGKTVGAFKELGDQLDWRKIPALTQ
jgi:hypothetical protein